MRVRNEESGNDSESHFAATCLSATEENNLLRPKFNASFEKKIEYLWFQSEILGWSYNDFAVHLLEVLVVLRHRNSVKLAAASKRRIAA